MRRKERLPSSTRKLLVREVRGPGKWRDAAEEVHESPALPQREELRVAPSLRDVLRHGRLMDGLWIRASQRRRQRC